MQSEMRSYKDFKHCERRGELCIGDDAGKLPGGSLKKKLKDMPDLFS